MSPKKHRKDGKMPKVICSKNADTSAQNPGHFHGVGVCFHLPKSEELYVPRRRGSRTAMALRYACLSPYTGWCCAVERLLI